MAVPADVDAEREVVGTAVASRHGAGLARRRVRPADFYDRTMGRLFGAALCLDDVARLGVRIAAVATMCDVSFMWLGGIVDARSLMHDDFGRFAGRVADAAERRRHMAVLVDEIERLAGDAA